MEVSIVELTPKPPKSTEEFVSFELIEKLARPIPIVFTTAYDQYALTAFEVTIYRPDNRPFVARRCAAELPDR